MDGYTISQVAERTGFPATTLRYYEQSGLVRPGRTAAGYRCYDDTHLELLSFIGRAKGFGLSLEEITELLTLLGDDECAPVQHRLRDLVDTKIADAQTKVAELTAFTIELQRVAASLGGHTPDGPCDDTCGCTTDHRSDAVQPVALGRRSDPPIACTLSGDQMTTRLAAWRTMAAGATSREATSDGTRLRFERTVDVADLAALVAAEQDCCRFFTFTLTVGIDEVILDVTAPADARPTIDALVGAS
jgi:DNA-binding transcriptional MerR regulator